MARVPALHLVTYGMSERTTTPSVDFILDVRHVSHPLLIGVLGKKQWRNADGREDRLVHAMSQDRAFPRLVRHARWLCGRGRPEGWEERGVRLGIVDFWGRIRSVAVSVNGEGVWGGRPTPRRDCLES